jgi:N-methylhydantoinase A
MIRALRVVTVQRGVDPRRYVLLTFGGAGPLHAAQIADELGIDTILCPRASGVLAALGLVVSQRRRDVQRSVLWSGDDLSADAIAGAVDELAQQARRTLGEATADIAATYELRYRGQSFELAIAAETDASPEELRERFESAHEDRYGYSDPDQPLELVTIRVTATTPGADVELAGAAGGTACERFRRPATIASNEVQLDVLRGSPAPGTQIPGPAIVELPESTVLVPGHWTGDVDDTGTVRLRRAR